MSNLFGLLNAISHGNHNYIDELSDAEIADLSPYVVNMWISNPEDMVYERVFYTNRFVNQHVFPLQKHPRLIFHLMAIAQQFGKTRYAFPRKIAKETNTNTLKLVQEYYSVRKEIAELYLQSLSQQDIMKMADEMGYQKDQRKKIENEFL